MKSMLVLLLLTCSATCLGQASDADVKALVEKALRNNGRAPKSGTDTALPRVRATGSLPLQGFISGKKVPAGVYALAGGMPCIVPDRTGIAVIPNLFGPVRVPFKSGIPNAHPPAVTPPSK